MVRQLYYIPFITKIVFLPLTYFRLLIDKKLNLLLPINYSNFYIFIHFKYVFSFRPIKLLSL